MSWWLAALTAALHAQSFEAVPTEPRQGDVVRLAAPAGAASARMNGRTVPLFDGRGLMPVHPLEKPGVYRLEFLSAGGQALESASITVRSARFPRQNITLGKALTELKPSPDENATAERFRKSVTSVRQWSEPFVPPVPGCRTSSYGVQRFHNGKPTGNFHAGLDQRGPAGEPVRAVAAGSVRIVRMWNLRGGTVAIDHGQGMGSMYLHLSRFSVEEGAGVKPGDVIGYIGSTGRSTAPHLHWSLYIHGVPVNPAPWVKVAPCAAPKKK